MKSKNKISWYLQQSSDVVTMMATVKIDVFT